MPNTSIPNNPRPKWLLATMAAFVVVGCGGNATYSPTVAGTGTQPAQVAISIVSPNPASTLTGGTLQYTAVVTGTSNKAVTWSVVTEEGGSISNSGLYQAPGTPGTYTIEATSQADSTKSATATATVTSDSGSVGGTIH